MAFRELSEGERQALYGRMVPESGLVLREVAVGVPVDRDKVRCPVLALAGESDGVCPPRVLRAVARHYETKPLIYPGIDHWIMNEAGWEKPAADIAGWLDGLAVDG